MSGGIYTTDKTKTLLNLQDVDVNNLTNGQALIYDSTTETFTNQDINTELSNISTVANELIKKDGTNTNFVRAHIVSTDSSVGPLTTQKTTFVNSQPPVALQLSSIESIFNNGFYSMILNPHESNIEQKGMTLKAFLNEVLVGINTDAPAEGLHLLGNFRIDNNTTQQIRFYNIQGSTKEAGTIKVDDNGGGADMLFLTRPSSGIEPTEKMIIDKNGNVGIGTSSPSQKLDVNGNIQLDSTNRSRIIFYDKQNNHEHAEIDSLGKGANGGQLIFYTKNNGGSVSEKMRIIDDGGVGIGTNNPSQKLDVDGNIKINDTILGTNNQIELYTNTEANDSYSFLELRELITTIGCPEFRILTGSSNVNAGSERLKILSNGNVGIGTSTPSQKLDVNGTIRGSNLITEGYLELNPDGGLLFNAQLRHDRFIGDPKPDQVKMFLRNHNFWTIQEGIGNGGDGTRKMIIDAPLEVNATIKSGTSFYVYDILHQRLSASAYIIEPALGWSDIYNSRARLVLNQYVASLQVLNDTGAELTSISPYKDGNIYYRGVLYNVSDDRLKSYETDVSGATDMILKLKPKFYKKHPTLITDDPTPDLSDVLHYDEYGFIAQDLNEDPKLSHFVRENPETKIYHVNYVEMIPLLVQTIKELVQTTKELNERIKVLESRE
jgi:hypothetical protein